MWMCSLLSDLLFSSQSSENEHRARLGQVFSLQDDQKQVLTQKSTTGNSFPCLYVMPLQKTHSGYTMATSREGSRANTAWWQPSVYELTQGSIQTHTHTHTPSQILYLYSINGPCRSVQEEREGHVLIKKHDWSCSRDSEEGNEWTSGALLAKHRLHVFPHTVHRVPPG